MLKYIIRRLIYSLPVLFGVLLVTFVLARAVPGDPCKAILGEKATQEVCDRFIKEKGLDKPVYQQFAIYVKDLAQGDLGTSIRFRRPITQILSERLPTTVELGMAALIIATAIGIPLGMFSALRHNSAFDVGTMVFANIGVSMPVFWLGLMLIYLFALVLKDTPFALPPSGRLSPGVVSVPFYEVWGMYPEDAKDVPKFLQFLSNLYVFNALITANWEVFKDAVRHLILPSLALATIPMAIIARMTRSSMLQVTSMDYVRTARAKGLQERVVVLRHIFRNALLPLVTVIGLQLGVIFSGAILTETIFSLAGVGRSLFEAITSRDYPVIQGFTVVIAIGYIFLNLFVDLTYGFLDPRIRIE
jgi:peptide/nickel transport system permease protein